jgi:acyl-coenzyme A thioesterase 13
MSKKPDTDKDPSKIAGNASLEVKEYVSTVYFDLMTNTSGRGFAFTVGERLLFEEISFLEKVEDPERMEARIVLGVTVEQGMSDI